MKKNLFEMKDVMQKIIEGSTEIMGKRTKLLLKTAPKDEYIETGEVTLYPYCYGTETITFPAVKKGNFYAIWVEEQSKWLGIENEKLPEVHGESGGANIYSGGPYELGLSEAEMIASAYYAYRYPLAKVLETSPEELKGSVENLKIRITRLEPNGMEDTDLSIYIPVKGEIEKEVPFEVEGDLEETIFIEHEGHQFTSDNWPRWPKAYTALKIDKLYMLWIPERKEWIGIYYYNNGLVYEGASGYSEDMYADGPFKLNEFHAAMLRNKYSNDEPLDKILHKSPEELMKR